jgi:hypothetical protein
VENPRPHEPAFTIQSSRLENQQLATQPVKDCSGSIEPCSRRSVIVSTCDNQPSAMNYLDNAIVSAIGKGDVTASELKILEELLDLFDAKKLGLCTTICKKVQSTRLFGK